MDAFKTHQKVIEDYRSYLSSFLSIQDERIEKEVKEALHDKGFLPEPLVQFNPAYSSGSPLADLVKEGKAHQDLPRIFGDYRLYKHQIEALELGIAGRGFVVTSGTGSGKSLTFLATIFNDLLKQGEKKKAGVKAILVYPMNALINSQEEEIKKFESNYGEGFPISYAKYTGQESQDDRAKAKVDKPDIILTNYMMLELIMTRKGESWLRDSLVKNLKYLVFDELHTYRGRQGSDVSLLIRRIKGLAENAVQCIGTSATMASGGTPLEKRQAVSFVAEQIFGDHFHQDQIIPEYLNPCTSGKQPDSNILSKTIDAGIDKSWDETVFVDHPLTNWLESSIALQLNEDQLERGIPLTIDQISSKLSEDSGKDLTTCKEILVSLLRWTEFLNETKRKANSRQSYLPFKFHQFISQTSIVSVTLESRRERQISIKPGRYVKTEEGDLLLFPVLFSRISGFDFICVEKDVESNKLLPRGPDEAVKSITKKDAQKSELGESSFSAGYVVLDEGEDFWNEDPIEYVPDSWLNRSKTALTQFYKWQLPQRIYFDEKGNYSSEDVYPYKGFFMSAKLRVDPTAGVVYEDVKTGEHTKLMRIGNEGRSTATSVISLSIIDALHEQGEADFDQKVLSFTDNRQDASLQAGHFNDFISTARYRSALNTTLKQHSDGLNVHNIAERLYEILGLDEARYAKNPTGDKDFPDVENIRALKTYLLLRTFQDLKRGWRYTLPNLEQTALLKVKYNQVPKLSALSDRFESLPTLYAMTPELREDFLVQFLNYFRTSFSLDHRILLDDRGETESFLKNKLDEKKLWSLDHNERIDAPRYLTVVSPGKTQYGIYTASIGPRSGLGKFTKRIITESRNEAPDTDELISFIEGLCELLVSVGLLSKNDNIKGSNTGGNGVTGYLLRTDSITWFPGDEQNVGIDQTRINNFRPFKIVPNQFFQKLYKKDFTQFDKELEGREHTGQLSNEDKIEREVRFRKGEISSLFCSPTMELGIDIANLNVVHMRNVPPNPANYAQRSGRAGRSGQTALVFTYCSSLSPHDQNYFNAAETMVAGAVVPPRIDLLNEELIRTHLHAYLLMELELGDLHSSVATILDLERPDSIPIQQRVKDQIENSLTLHGSRWADSFRSQIVNLVPELQKTWWYRDEWFMLQTNAFIDNFDRAFERWRNLYKSAKSMIERSRTVLDDPTIKHSSPEFKDAKRQHNVGLVQIDLLKNDRGFSYGNQSEFYIFRYLASEGFIPGYNFTRLPVRAFVGWKFQDRGEYISRPRFIALREFGPNNLIYHKGNKHRITRMMMTNAEALQRKIKISHDTGYAFLDSEAVTANNDPITKTELRGDKSEFRTKLIEVSETEAIPQMRISCEEEERMSTGFDIDHYFNYSSGVDSTTKSVVKSGNQDLLNLIYGPATNLIALNRQWRKSAQDGFSIDQRNGQWLRQKDLEKPEIAENEQRVMIFAQDTADTLYIQPLENLDLDADGIISLSYALKRGIEVLFQVEESEIGISIVGNKESPNVLIYESAQGSLGILSQLVSEPEKLKELFRVTYSCMHFDPETRTETERGKELPKASYEDLLSYFNQRHHEILNRNEIRQTLEFLMDCSVDGQQGGVDREEHYKILLERYDKSSATELKLLRYLYDHCLALPDRAQVNVPDFYISADFVYNRESGPVLVFCDGSVHDRADVQEDDRHKREHLLEKGYDIIEWNYKEPLEDLVEERKDIFRKVC